jgi:hypothetical protein
MSLSKKTKDLEAAACRGGSSTAKGGPVKSGMKMIRTVNQKRQG